MNPADYVQDSDTQASADEGTAGVYTVEDIFAELRRPGLDPRGSFRTARFSESVSHFEDVRPGMVLAIEPMLTAGSPATRELDDGWTVVTQDGSHAAQWEHTVAIVPGGVWVLTAPDGGAEGLAPYGIEPKALG